MTGMNGELGCVPNSISPATWIPGFSDSYEKASDFACAIATNDTAQIDLMAGCCDGEIQTDEGCYHWCKPKAIDIEGWATCIADEVYTDTDFGQACNQPGELALKSAREQHEAAPAGSEEDGPDSGRSAGVRLGFEASWKLGVFIGVVGLVQVMC